MNTRLLSFVAALILLAAKSASSDTLPIEDTARLARQELEAARSGDFYYVLDVPNRKLVLKLKGVELHKYAVESIEIGTPLGVRFTPDALRSLFECEVNLPETRLEIRPGTVDQEFPATPVNGSKTEEEPSVSAITLPCEPSLLVRFIAATRASLGSALRDRLALSGERRADSRLRIVVPDGDLFAIRGGLPSKAKLLIILPRVDAVAAPSQPKDRPLLP